MPRLIFSTRCYLATSHLVEAKLSCKPVTLRRRSTRCCRTHCRFSHTNTKPQVTDPAEKKLGADLRARFEETVDAVLEVTGHTRLLEDNARLRRLIEMRNPYIDPINILQVGGLCELRLLIFVIL